MGMISQEDLKNYHTAKKSLEALEETVKGLRQKLLDRFGLGDAVEKGPFTLEILSSSRTNVDPKLLVEAIAKEYGPSVANKFKEGASKKVEFPRVEVKMT